MSNRGVIFGLSCCVALGCGGNVGTSSNESHDPASGGGHAWTGGASTSDAGTSSSPPDGIGGEEPHTGGTPAVGGVAMGSSGGLFATGGTAAGGMPRTAGGPSTGGQPITGGVASFGGIASSGGAPSEGGEDPGGRSASGGESGTAGANGTGSRPGRTLDFVGNTTSRGGAVDADGLIFSDHWDQLTPENAGKWGAVQPTHGGAYNWAALDALYDYAETHHILFKEHTFIWGSALPSGTYTEEDVVDWISSYCERYPNTALIDVVNEPPPHTQPSYVDAIGGGTNGTWQWITNSFLWAREYCPEAVLILNDYNIIEFGSENERIIDIVNTIQEAGAPIDAVGAQGHALAHTAPRTVQQLLQRLHDETGLPVYITEMDIDLEDDQEQLEGFQTFFPMFRDADFVPGITVWGWIYGATWIPHSGLVRNGVPRPAMVWLMNELGRPVPSP